MEVTGKIKLIGETKSFGTSEFKKREVRVTTDDQYPQIIPIEFVQDKCDLLNSYKVGDDVKISVNLRGNEWTNPAGEVKCFPNIQGWRIEKTEGAVNGVPTVEQPTTNEQPDDLPF